MMRKFPIQYSPEVKAVLNAMSIGTPNVVGSSIDRRLLYSADYDMIQEVELSPASSRAFVQGIAQLYSMPNTHIVDIKIGDIPEWNLLKGSKYSRSEELKHLGLLYDTGIISEKEYKHAKKLLSRTMSDVKMMEAKKELRFGVLRWTPKDVFKGYLKLRNGETISLVEAFKTSGITKVDVIAFVNGKYADFSNILLWKGYSEMDEPIQSLKQNVIYYVKDGNYWKALKRIFSLAKGIDDEDIQQMCLEVLNSKLGYLATIISDMEVLESLKQRNLTKKEKQNIKAELGAITDRLAKVYIDGFKRPKKTSFSLLPKLQAILQHETKLAMEEIGLLPIPLLPPSDGESKPRAR